MNKHKQDTLHNSEITIGTDAMKMRFLLLPITAKEKDLACMAVQVFFCTSCLPLAITDMTMKILENFAH